jgi:hypothetical protein
MPDKTEWQLDRNGRRSRVDIGGSGVLVASTCGPEGSEVGSVVSHQEFVEGKYQDVIRKVFGAEVLAEMVGFCEEILAQRASG